MNPLPLAFSRRNSLSLIASHFINKEKSKGEINAGLDALLVLRLTVLGKYARKTSKSFSTIKAGCLRLPFSEEVSSMVLFKDRQSMSRHLNGSLGTISRFPYRQVSTVGLLQEQGTQQEH
jgi:hypothetical protein